MGLTDDDEEVASSERGGIGDGAVLAVSFFFKARNLSRRLLYWNLPRSSPNGSWGSEKGTTIIE